jgi:hypothetical protein
MRRLHGPNPYPGSTLLGQMWEFDRALRNLGFALVDSLPAWLARWLP